MTQINATTFNQRCKIRIFNNNEVFYVFPSYIKECSLYDIYDVIVNANAIANAIVNANALYYECTPMIIRNDYYYL